MSKKDNFSPIEKGFDKQWNFFSKIKNQGSDGFESVDLQLISSLEDQIIFLTPFKSKLFVNHFSQLRKRKLTNFQLAHELLKAMISGTFGKFSDSVLLEHGISLILTIITNGKYSPQQRLFKVSLVGERKHVKVLFYSKYLLEFSPKTIPEIVLLIEILVHNIYSSTDNNYIVTKEAIQNILTECLIYQPSKIWLNEEEPIKRFLSLISYEIASDTYGVQPTFHEASNITKNGIHYGFCFILYSLFQKKVYFFELIKNILLTKWYFIFEPSIQPLFNKIRKLSFLKENLAKSLTHRPLTDETSLGGFEPVFGRTQRTGNEIVGVSPCLFYLFSYIKPGSQILLEGLDLSVSVVPVEKLSPPLIINKNQELIRLTLDQKINEIAKILSMGDILIDRSLLKYFNQELKIIEDVRSWIIQIKRKWLQNTIIEDANPIFFNKKLYEYSKFNLNFISLEFLTFLIDNDLPIPYFLLPKWKNLLKSELELFLVSLMNSKISDEEEIIFNYNESLLPILYEGHIPFLIKEGKIIALEFVNFFFLLKKSSQQLIEVLKATKSKNESINFYKFLKESLNYRFSYRNPLLGAVVTKTWKSILMEDSPQKFGIISKNTLEKVLKSNSNFKNYNFYTNEESEENFQKSIIRKNKNISIFNGPNFVFQLPNSAITQFKPLEITTSVLELRNLGYRIDKFGKIVENEEQILNIFLNDIILPKSIFKKLKSIYDFIDEELVLIYNQKPYFKIIKEEDVIGNFFIGCNPNGSTGVKGRLIGWFDDKYDNNCLIAHPLWHASKYSNCSNEEPDNLFVLEDLILNFNLNLLASNFNNLPGKPIFIKEKIILDDVLVSFRDFFDNFSNNFINKNNPIKFEKKKKIQTKNSIPNTSLNMEPDFFDSLKGIVTQSISNRTKKDLSASNFHKQMPLELTRFEFNLIENNIESYSYFYYGNQDFIRKLYFENYIFPRFMAQLDLWLEQSIECPDCGYPYPYAIFKNCTNCGHFLELVYDKGPIIKQYKLIKDLFNKYPSALLNESFYYIKNQFKLVFPTDEKIKIDS